MNAGQRALLIEQWAQLLDQSFAHRDFSWLSRKWKLIRIQSVAEMIVGDLRYELEHPLAPPEASEQRESPPEGVRNV